MKFNRFLRLLQEEAGNGEGGAGGGGADGSDNGADNGDGGLLAGKYNSQDDLVAGYLELQTAFSGKDEAHNEALAKFLAPEAYTPKEGWGSENTMDNRLMAVLQDVGREQNLTQEGYEAMFDGITDMQTRVREDGLKDIVKSIPNFDTRSGNMRDVALKYLRPDQAEAMDTLMTTKESFEAVELLMNQLKGGALPANVGQQNGITDGELRDQLNKLNPSDTRGRAKLLKEVNARGEGQGKLV